MSEAHDGARPSQALVSRHLRVGWLLLFVYLSMGLLLEVLHGFKVGFYLDVSNETRRHMWTLAHTHGTLIGLVNLGFAATLTRAALAEGVLKLASPCLVIASVFMPLGFLLGGIVIYEGDPGLPVLLVPAAGGFFALGVGAVAYGLLRPGESGDR